MKVVIERERINLVEEGYEPDGEVVVNLTVTDGKLLIEFMDKSFERYLIPMAAIRGLCEEE